MRNRLLLTIFGAIALALIAAAGALAHREAFRVGNLILEDNSGIFPDRLPRHRQAPISAVLRDWFSTTDGTHLPAFEHAVGNFDKHIHVNAKGLPVCKLSQLVARSTAAARRACSKAIVGSGDGEVEVAFPEQQPFSATGPILLFNGGVHGGTTLLLVHAYVAVPAPTAVLVQVKISRVHLGRLGLHVSFRVPPIAGGYGSAKRFKVVLGRKFTYKGQKQSYLTASCPTGRYYTDSMVYFSGNMKIHVPHVFPCTPTD